MHNMHAQIGRHAHTHECTHTRARAHSQTHTHTRTHARTHACTHAHTHTRVAIRSHHRMHGDAAIFCDSCTSFAVETPNFVRSIVFFIIYYDLHHYLFTHAPISYGASVSNNDPIHITLHGRRHIQCRCKY